MNWNSTPIPHPELPCPFCGGRTLCFPDHEGDEKKGVTLICLNPTKCIPTCHENPFGHADNPKEAHVIMCEKFRKPSS